MTKVFAFVLLACLLAAMPSQAAPLDVVRCIQSTASEGHIKKAATQAVLGKVKDITFPEGNKEMFARAVLTLLKEVEDADMEVVKKAMFEFEARYVEVINK